ncbi:DUF1980 domain-containing protein, partial [Enterococcus faecium]|uniref:DUF1980 domain-containing protein n=1 Tax=Enterococcus faecium TaxID=1352 RepID=UPI003CC67AA2
MQVSGNLDQYINVLTRYLAFLSKILSALLALVQLYLWVNNGKAEEETHEHDDVHDHGLSKPYQRGIAYVLVGMRVFVGTSV